MAETVQLDNDKLYPGDIIRFDFEILSDNQVLIGLAVKSVKDRIAADDRLDYQGSAERTVGDLELKRDVRMLSIYAQVRRYRRGDRPELQLAIAWVPLSIVVAAVAGALVYYGSTLRDLGHVVERIVTNPNLSDAQKQAALAALGGGSGVGAGLAAMGGGLVTAAIVIAVLWALSLSRPARSAEY
jgi:hypothetical protein